MPAHGQEPSRYVLSTLPDDTPLNELVGAAHQRWRIWRDYPYLKRDSGLRYCDGRGWRGFHHHARLSIAAYGFLMTERRIADKSVGGKELSSNAKYLPFPRMTAPAAVVALDDRCNAEDEIPAAIAVASVLHSHLAGISLNRRLLLRIQRQPRIEVGRSAGRHVQPHRWTKCTQARTLATRVGQFRHACRRNDRDAARLGLANETGREATARLTLGLLPVAGGRPVHGLGSIAAIEPPNPRLRLRLVSKVPPT